MSNCVFVIGKERCGRSEADHDEDQSPMGSGIRKCPHGRKRCPRVGHDFDPPCRVEDCGESELEHHCNCVCHIGNTPGYHCERCDGGPLGHDFVEDADDLVPV